ncbi:hypothetical protein PF003_g24187 [Phytophthora fragariae]|nr:hypothetical protein PF003_g24187 [Phytophthora fragariae]
MPSVVQRTQMLNNWWGKTYQRMMENDTLNLFGSRSGAEDGEHSGAIGCERRRPGLAVSHQAQQRPRRRQGRVRARACARDARGAALPRPEGREAQEAFPGVRAAAAA